jgi:hypothetical protein
MTDPIAQLTSVLPARYAIERELGRGGMATVFLARDRKHQRQVALKVLRPEVAAAVGQERFLREIEIVAGLSHPHILPLHDSGHTDQCVYFVMPYVDGESLRERLDRDGPLPIEDAVKLARETADALAHAHAHGVIHRDIKPENILLEAGHAVVADFGVALVLDRVGAERLTATGGTPGTPLYISPEQAGGGGTVDARTDIYSLGCVLYEMLIGEAPYTGGTAQAIMARKMFEPVPRMRVVRDTVPEAVEAVVRKALAKMPADRFPTAADFSDALADAMRRPAVGVPPTEEGVERQAGRTSTLKVAGRFDSTTRAIRGGLLGTLGAAALVGLIGFLNILVLDARLGVPASLSPSETDFFVTGLRAVVPFAIYVTVTFLVYEVAKSLLHGFLALARRVTPVGRSLEKWPQRVSSQWQALWQPAGPSGIAESVFVVSLLAGGGLLLVFWPLLSSMWALEGHAEILACSRRPFHRIYQLVTPIVIAILGVACGRIFRHLRNRGEESRNVTLARWGSCAWIVFLFVFTAMPWQLLWGSDRERALLDGDRAYVVAEDQAGLLVYNAEEGVTIRYRPQQAGLRRLGINGYMFEEPAAFRSGQPECAALE